MNELKNKLLDFKENACNYELKYELEDGTCFSYKIKQSDFPHAIGLHKLIDIPIIRKFNDVQNPTISASYINKKIKQESILTDTIIRSSRYFETIRERYLNFSADTILTTAYTDVIVDFDAAKANSSLKGRFILFSNAQGGRNYLSIGYDCMADRYYLETYFYNKTDRYLCNQHIIKVKKIEITDNYHQPFLSDEF